MFVKNPNVKVHSRDDGKTQLANSSFPQMHKIDIIAIIANFVLKFLQFPSLFTLCFVSKCETRCQWVQED